LRNAEKSDIVKCKEGGRCMIAEKEKKVGRKAIPVAEKKIGVKYI
jgi:hypothetical protein